MRTKIVTVNGKSITVQEKRIGELEKLIADLFPGCEGKISKITLENVDVDFDLIYDKLPVIFPELTKDDIKNAYMSELEALVQAFIDVNFFGIKKMMGTMMRLVPISSTQKQ